MKEKKKKLQKYSKNKEKNTAYAEFGEKRCQKYRMSLTKIFLRDFI